MYKKTTLVLVSALLTFQVSIAAVVPRDAADDATKLLNDLRKAANDALTKGFMDYVNLSDMVDAAAQEAKGDSMDEMLIMCVNNQAKKAIDALYMAVVTATESAYMPVSDEEKKIVECGGMEKGCLSDVIDELGADMDSVPDAITMEIKTDSDMIDDQIAMIKACGMMASKSQKAAPAKGPAADAKKALNALRKVTLDNLNKAFLDYTGCSDIVDSTAQMTKNMGSMDDMDAVAKCVNTHADAALDMVYDAGINLTKAFLKPVYDAEEQLVVCGLSDDDCNSAALKDLLSKVDSTPGDINTEVQMDIQAVSNHILAMKSCTM